MRLYALILCGFLMTICAEPDPKKYKSQIKEKTKHSNSTLTADEKKFLREIEAKFGIQNDSIKEEKTNATTKSDKATSSQPGHFPAVIAIEIVNDTDTKTKGKRTIDANLGYGYKTNNGYTYSYFGKPSQEKGKFMIYPYSQAETPAGQVQSFHTIHHYEKPNGKNVKTSVEIHPSQAFELVKVKDEKSGYNYEKPAVEFKTPSAHAYSTSSYTSHPSTLYTTYNGDKFSTLSGQFPTVMQNYLVDPSQLIKNPEYQNVGLTQDHLRGSHIEQKVVPVLVLRIPSSVLTSPTAELYANLPHNYPLSNYLNNLNLQELVNQYFKKSGYNFAPQVMAYSSPLSSAAVESSAGSSVSQYEPQHYAHPYVQPSYTHSHTSGVQYSAVQPVMAKYPSSYTRHHYSSSKGHSYYKQPSLSQKYEYQYQYFPHSSVSSQKYYMPSHYQQQAEQAAYEQLQSGYSSLGHSVDNQDTNAQIQYETPGHVTSGYESSVTHDIGYGSRQANIASDYTGTEAKSAADYAASLAQLGSVYATPQAQILSEYAATQAQAGTGYGSSQSEYQVQYDNSNGDNSNGDNSNGVNSDGDNSNGDISNGVNSEYSVPKDENSQSLPTGYESSVTASPSPYSATENAQDVAQEYYIQNNQQSEQGSESVYPSQATESDISQIESSGHQNYVYQHQPQESSEHGLILTENYPSKDHTIATVYPTQQKAENQKSVKVQSVSYVTPSPQSKYKIPYQVMVPQTYLHNPTSEKVAYVHSQPMSASYSESGLHQDNPSAVEHTLGYHYTPASKHRSRNYQSYLKRMARRNEKSDSKNKSDKNENKSS
ncbi:unnamed protein product [Arctia plantaginis]|uniref:Uncharacterized protein n=1 Tax=Arctia plantaginis TaxID=874455 RepID=A0A8S1AIB7_ARCPL|nr:unnamed protein product [Arctia plantaginis]